MTCGAFDWRSFRGHLHTELDRLEDNAVLRITDSGPGIFEHERRHVFTRFFKGTKDSSKSGMGLGLFIAKGFVDAFGGTISMQSPLEAGNGTKVTMILPLVPAADIVAVA